MGNVSLTVAVDRARHTLDVLLTAFTRRTHAQTDFLVVYLQEQANGLYVPVGVKVESIDTALITGRLVHNTLDYQPSQDTVACHKADIVDWRYVDALELEGGATYRALYADQPLPVQRAIGDIQPFLIDRKKPFDQAAMRIMRDLANGRCDVLRNLTVADLTTIRTVMPVRTFDIGRRVIEVNTSAVEYAVMYGNAEVIDLLYEKGALKEEAGQVSPLCDSSRAGNMETTRRLLELGFDVNCSNRLGFTPLIEAVVCSHEDLVRMLIKHRADPNGCHAMDGTTPLFDARASAVAEALIKAGANVDALDNNGDSCLAVQLFRGNRDVVRVLVESGAELKYGPRGVGAEQRVDGRAVAMEYLESTGEIQALHDFELAHTVDYGCVLPVRSLVSTDLE